MSVDLEGHLLGSYRVVSRLGEGGMGVVYRADHTLLRKRAAVKVLHKRVSHDSEVVQRFFMEARAAARVEHPGIIEIYDFGRREDGSAYIIMELLEGESLRARMEREQRLDVQLAAGLARDVALALAAAHGAGIVHRDLKPDNVFLSVEPSAPFGVRLKILDFGIAKLMDVTNPGVFKTRTGAILGSPIYMSPEQCEDSARVDWRSDIYSLGCLLFEMISGRPPFVAEGAGRLIAAHIYDVPPALTGLVPNLPASLGELVGRMLAKKPDERPQWMEEIATELGRIADGTELATGSASIPREAGAAPRPRRLWPALAAIAAGLVAGGLIFWRHTLPGASSPEPTSRAAAPPPTAAPSEPPAPVLEPPSAPPPAPAVARPLARNVKLTLRTRPKGAEVWDPGGKLIGRTPLTIEREASAGEASFVLKKSGFASTRVTVAADRDGEVQRDLAPRRASRSPAPAPAPEKVRGDEPIDPF